MKPFKPINERIIVQPLPPEARESGLLVSTALEPELRGVILAIGEGGTSASGAVIPPKVKVGDTVIYDSTGVRKMVWKLGEVNVDVHMITERQILGTT